MTRVITTASSKRSRPEAISQTTTGAATTPTTQVTTQRPEQHGGDGVDQPPGRLVAVGGARVAARIGTKACEKAPSPNSRRSRLGMRKATLKASNEAPAPNTDETTMSRTSPVTREASVKQRDRRRRAEQVHGQGRA